MTNRKIPAIWLIIFFLSGFTSLVYEVAFMRFFMPIIGMALPAVTAVVCAFFSGMALGSLIAPRLLLKIKKPIWLYAGLEFGIGLSSIALVFSKQFLIDNYLLLSHSSTLSGNDFLVRFCLVGAAFFIPTMLMGAAFPICTDLFFRSERRQINKIGALYCLNLLGAAAGSLLCGFYFLETFGISGTVLITAVINFLLAVLVLLRFKSDLKPFSVSNSGQIFPSKIFFFYFLVGMGTMILEMVWFRLLIFFIGGAAHSFSILLSVFLLCSAIGSWFFGERLNTIKFASGSKPRQILGLLSSAVGYFAILSFSLLGWFNFNLLAKTSSWLGSVTLSFILIFFIIAPCTICLGGMFALLSKHLEEFDIQPGPSSGFLFGINSIGSVIGCLGATFLLLDYLGMQNTLVLACGMFCLLGLLLNNPQGAFSRRILVFKIVAFATVLSFSGHDIVRRLFSDRLGELLFYKESARDIVAVHKVGNSKNLRLAFNDGRGTCSTFFTENKVARLLAHTSMAMNPLAKDVLVISFGCGNTASAFAKHAIRSLDIAEISLSVQEAAPFFWTNQNVASDPRVRFHNEDGRNFLLKSEKLYDVIELEPPNLLMDGVVFLYTQEFYQLARSRLKPGGVISQWINAAKTGQAASHSLIHTITKEFPNAVLFQSHWAWWINATEGKEQELFPEDAIKSFSKPEVVQDLRDLQITLQGLKSHILAVTGDITKTVEYSRLVADDDTYVDYTTPRIHSETVFNILKDPETPSFFR